MRLGIGLLVPGVSKSPISGEPPWKKLLRLRVNRYLRIHLTVLAGW